MSAVYGCGDMVFSVCNRRPDRDWGAYDWLDVDGVDLCLVLLIAGFGFVGTGGFQMLKPGVDPVVFCCCLRNGFFAGRAGGFEGAGRGGSCGCCCCCCWG